MERGRLRVVLFSALVLLFFAAGESFAKTDNGLETLRKTSKAFTAVANKTIPAVVFVNVQKTIEISSPHGGRSPFGYDDSHGFFDFDEDFLERFFGYRQPRQRSPRKYEQLGQGSGFIISQDGYILTNNHVVGEVDKITVTLQDGRKFDAKVVGTDPKSDVAVIKVEAENLPVIELGDSDALEVGEWVIAIGNPFGLDATVTVGVVSAKGRGGIGIADYEDFIQTDAAINLGNSGGPLLNLEGKAVGLNTAIFSLSRSGGYMGIGFAIPINMAKHIKQQLVETGKVTRGYLGVYMEPVKADLAEYFGLKQKNGVSVLQVMDDSPADDAGLKAGDIILEMDGKKIEGMQQFKNTIAMVEPGTKVTLLVYRDGKELKKEVEIGSLGDSSFASDVSEVGEQLGLQVQELTEELARGFGYEPGEGVLVSEVTNGGIAAKAGIRAGMLIVSVNRRDVNSVAEFNTALEETAKTRKALMLIKYENFAQYVVLTLD
jgi:serine protease Do